MLDDLKEVAASRHNTLGVPGFKTSMKRLGVSSPNIKTIVNNWSRILYDFTSRQWIDLSIQLTQTGVFEAQILAYELLWKNKNALKKLNQKQILLLGDTLDNWVSTDSYCTMIAGWHWREGTLSDTQILNWLKSEDHWLRRVAVVCTIPLNLRSKGGIGDPRRTLMVCEKVLDDRDDLIVKALSWALRELSKSNKQAVENFMEKHWEQLHPRVRREVMAKLETGRKNG
jgi:3-methyladenine DNA glycosylase AlkD